jgi:hypothetical protein
MQQHQYSLALIQHQLRNAIVEQRADDGYINATALCQAAGKRWHNYVRNETTGHFLRALDAKTQIRVSELIQEVRSAAGTAATWVHPKVAIHLAQWLSADFAVQVTEWVYEWMDRKAQPDTGPVQLPPHLQRYISNDGRVPPGYFSVLQETGLNLFGPLHNVGFEIPKGWVPDISVGLKFCAHLRGEHDVDTDALPQYRHDYLDGRPPVLAKLYPEDYLPVFRRWFRSSWLPNHGVEYFKRKDPASLPYLDRLPALAAPTNRQAIPPRV